jgi:Meckel syndrome type 1 protein
MATPDQMQQDADEFASAYAEDAPQQAAQTDDEAFGLADTETPDEDQAEMAEEPGEPSAAEAGGEPDAEAPSVVIEPDAVSGGDVASDEPMDPKELQREKSWEGRLRAKEAELKAREDALKSGTTGEPGEPGETLAEEAAEPAMTEAIEDAAEKVESGEMTYDQAMATLSNDFGPDFTKMLGVLINSKAQEIAGQMDEKVGSVNRDLDGIVSELVSEKEKMHFESISDAHPDFADVAGSAEFKEYVDALPASEKEAALNVIGSGSAKQINGLLTAYKDTLANGDEPDAAPDEMDDSAASAAEGVRSKGMQIPEQPNKSQDYEAAWNDF